MTVFDFKSILSDRSGGILFTSGYHLHGISFFILLLFSLYVALHLKWVSVTAYSWILVFFFVHWATLCVLVGEFSTFTFKVITGSKDLLLPFCSLFPVCLVASVSLLRLLLLSCVFHGFLKIETCFDFFLIFKKDFIYLFVFRERGREGERERETSLGCHLSAPQPGTTHATQACVLTRNQTRDPLLCGMTPN